MRLKLAIMLPSAALILLATSPIRADKLGWDDLRFWQKGGHSAKDHCRGDCGLACDCQPQTWYSASADLLWLGRGKADPNFLIVAPANAPTDSLLDASDLEFNVKAGVDVGLRSRRRNGQTWELRYFGIYDQLAHERRIYDDGDLDNTNDAAIVHFNGDLGSYTDLTTAYSSDLHSGEVNVWLRERWGFEPVVGFRWIRQNEDLEMFATTDLTEGALIDLSNNLYGGQVGLRRVLWQTPSRCRVDATLKGGVYYNGMTFDSEFRTLGATIPTFNETFSSTAFGGEIAVTAIYRFSPGFSVNIGYTGLWLDRVGLAADQMDNFDLFGGTGDVDLTTLIYQGGHFGFEFAR